MAIVASSYFPDTANRLYCETFEDVFTSIESGSVQYGVCAIENSLAGSINEIYDLLLTKNVRIIGEAYLKITMCLIELPGATPETITRVYSHPVALAQCHDFLDSKMPLAQRLEFHDTAGSVGLIKEKADPANAAIAGKPAAELHKLEVIASPIESDHGSATRFIILGLSSAVPDDANKTSFVITTSHRPGALYQALGVFAKRGINLTKLQSRPLAKSTWRYMFYIDVAIGINDKRLIAALEELDDQNCKYTVIGSYRASKK
ncbi:hypothetical protein BH23PAT2_BH23PAT2_09900 [soil metagenome]